MGDKYIVIWNTLEDGVTKLDSKSFVSETEAQDFLKQMVGRIVKESKVNESNDDFTYGFILGLQKSLKGVLGVEVDIQRIATNLSSLDRIALEALKKAMETRDIEVLKQFLNKILG